MPIDYSVLSQPISAAFDTDLIDIGRRQEIALPDGQTIETDPNEPLYTDIPCNIDYASVDNPDVNNDPTKPIIMSLKIYANANVDIRNGDYITARKRAADGTILEEYKGTASEPSQYQSRTEFVVGIRKNV